MKNQKRQSNRKSKDSNIGIFNSSHLYSRHGYLVDQGVSNRSAQRILKPSARRNNVGCQTLSKVGTDASTMTVDKNQSEELAQMIKVEAQKTIRKYYLSS